MAKFGALKVMVFKKKTERILLKHNGLLRLRVDGLNNACDSGTKGDEGDAENCVA